MIKVRPHKPKSLIWWHQHQNLIDMAPKYQRGSGLWSTHKRAFLIDSILNDYDMPKLYLADFNHFISALNKKRKPYAVIDGKQRLEAFNLFFEGKLKLNNDFVYNDAPSLRLAGLTYLDLKTKHPSIAEKVENHCPAIMSVITDNDGAIGQLFVRLNSGIGANGAERRNAMEGIVPDLIRNLAEHDFLTNKIKFSVLRMAEFNVAAKLLLIEYKGKFVDTKASNLDALVTDGLKKMNARRLRAAKKRTQTTLDEMGKIFYERDPLLTAGGAIPLYYWLVKSLLDNKDEIREFLDLFVHMIHENQKIIKEDPNAGNPELSQYYTMGRTTNDQGSLAGRFKILQGWFKGHLTRGN